MTGEQLLQCLDKKLTIVRDDIKKNYDAISSLRAELKEDLRAQKEDIMDRINRNVFRLDKLEENMEKLREKVDVETKENHKDNEARLDTLEGKMKEIEATDRTNNQWSAKLWAIATGIGGMISLGFTEIVIPYLKGLM